MFSGRIAAGVNFNEYVGRNSKNILWMNKNLVFLDLSPLESCKKVSLINLSNNKLVSLDLSPLTNLTMLEKLFLYNNKLKFIELESLRECNHLEWLDLGKNSLREIDLTPLQGKKDLCTLVINSNLLSIIDISPLFRCENLNVFKIDSGVKLIANEFFESQNNIPLFLQKHYRKIEWYKQKINDSYFSKVEHSTLIKKQDTPIKKSSFDTPPFYCQLCEMKHRAGTERLGCEICCRYVCKSSFEEMIQAGRTSCPMCEGKLVKN